MMYRLAPLLPVLVLCLAGAPGVRPSAVSAAESTAAPGSKLGIHLIGAYTEGARRVVSAGPPVIKVLDPQAIGTMREAMRDYKARHPKGLVVMRVWERTPGLRYRVEDDPADAAADFWKRVLEPAVNALPPEERKLVDFLEGPNEGDNTPTWDTVEAARWFGRFWVALAERIAGAGLRPCVGSIAVGNPPGTPEEVEARLEAFVPALRAALKHRGAWSYHAYSLQYTTDLGVELWYSLRYRRYVEYLAKRHPDLAGLPLILTEGGIDKSGNAKADGWRARGDAAKYQAWLRWFDREMRQDPNVLGVTLFQIGDATGWESFDLEGVAGWMADHITRSAGDAAPGAQRAPLFADDFAERREGWEAVSGAWAWRDGKLAQSAPADNYHRVVRGEMLVEGSIAVEGMATAVNSSGQGCIGVVCKHLDERNWVAVRYGAYGSVALLRVVEGKKEILPLRTLALEVGKAYRCEVRLGHGALVALLDGKVVGMQPDPFAGRPGRPGIYAQSPAAFTRIEVSGESGLDGGPAAALPAGTTRVTQESPAWALEGVEYAVAPLSPTVGSAASCSIALYLRNRGKEPASLTDVALDGKPAAALIEEGRMAWWRCRPERVAPGGVAQVLLRMASLEAHEAARIARKEALPYGIRLESAAGPIAVECALSPEPPPLRVHFIAFDQGLRTLHLYLGASSERVGRRVTRVEVNGADVTARTRIPGDGRLRADTLPLRVELPEALAPAAPVVVTVQAEGGTRAGHAVRAFPSRFPVQVVILGKHPGPEALAELAGLCFTDVGLCGGRPELVGEMTKHGLAYFPYAYPNAKAIDALARTPERPEVTGWWIDEIDGWKRTPRDAQEMLREADTAMSAAGLPPAPYCMNIMAPWGDAGYIELADALSHEYGIDGGIREQGSYRSAVDFGAPGDISRRELRTARRPWWPYFRNIEAVLLLEPETKKVVQHYRPIDPRELRLTVYSCLANGAKGALHWNYGLNYFTPKQLSWLSDKYDAIRMNMTALKEGEAFGVPIPRELRDGLRAATHECGRLNAELRLLGPLLAMGDVSDLAAVVRCSPERSVRGGPAAHARAILCGLDTIVLLAVNLYIDSNFNARKPQPVRSYEPVAAEVALAVPPWLRPADVFRVSWRGIEPLSPEKSEAGLRFSYPKLAVTEAVVVTADRSLRPRMQRDLKELQARLRTAGVRAADDR